MSAHTMHRMTALPGRALATWLVAAALLLGFTGTLNAQFTGPASGVNPAQNITPQPTQDPAILNPGSLDQEIAPGDVLTIKLYGQADFSTTVRVSTAGLVQLPLIGIINIGGLTVNRAEDLIQTRLINAGMYKDPQVTIQVTEAVGQFVTVGGEMHAVVPVAGDRRLLDVLAAAGSLPITASHIVTILRPGVDQPIVVDLGSDPNRSAQANIRILPRDTILISRVGVVYIVGAFKTQGAIPLQQTSPLTLMQAAALSGGPGYEGKFADLRIIRTTGLERKLVRVDISKVFAGKAPDPILQADDIVFLPSSGLKAAIKSGGIGTVLGIVSILVVALRN